MLRNKWKWAPSDDTTVTLSLDYAEDSQATGIDWSFLPGAFGVDGKTTYVGFYNTAGNFDGGYTDNNRMPSCVWTKISIGPVQQASRDIATRYRFRRLIKTQRRSP